MKKNEVEIGKVYAATVTGKLRRDLRGRESF